MKTWLASLGAEGAALILSILWLLLTQFLAVLAWDAGLLSRPAAVAHWVMIGVLPPALALAGMRPVR